MGDNTIAYGINMDNKERNRIKRIRRAEIKRSAREGRAVQNRPVSPFETKPRPPKIKGGKETAYHSVSIYVYSHRIIVTGLTKGGLPSVGGKYTDCGEVWESLQAIGGEPIALPPCWAFKIPLGSTPQTHADKIKILLTTLFGYTVTSLEGDVYGNKFNPL